MHRHTFERGTTDRGRSGVRGRIVLQALWCMSSALACQAEQQPGGSGGTGPVTTGGSVSAQGGAAPSGGTPRATGGESMSATGGTVAVAGTSGNSGAPGAGGSGAAESGGTANGGGGGTSGSSGSAGVGGASGDGGASGSSGSAGAGGAGASGGAGGPGGASGGFGGTAGGGGSGAISGGGGGRPTDGSGGAATGPMCKGTPITLKDAGACSSRLIGTAIAASRLNDSSYTNAAKEFNYATPENEMKWDAIEPSQGNFSYGQADQIVDFAKSNGMKVKGHTFVWHYALPNWVNSLGADQLRSAMVNHITQVINHYKGNDTVVAWDVVNEAWENDGSKFRNSPFSSKLGSGFVDEAFKAARAANPNVKLYYNDFRADGMNAKANAIYDMVKGMVERGVPIDGVGLQVHTGTPNPPSPPGEILQNMQRIAALGLEVVISEMDVHVCDGLTSEQQKQYYHDVIAACIAVPKCTAITFWGASDKYSWVKDFNETNCAGRNPSACLWDDNWMKKPAYTGVMDALQGK